MSRRWYWAIAPLVLASFSAPLQATDNAQGVSLSISPYIWLAGLDAEAAFPDGQIVGEVERDFGDLVDNVDAGLTLMGEARWERWGVLGDLVWLSLSNGGNTPGPAFSSADLETDLTMVSLAPYYRLVERKDLDLDLLVGARWWSVDSELQLGAGQAPAQQIDADQDWIEAIVGVRARVALTPDWFLVGYGDVGTGSGDADSSWQLYGAVGYQFNETWSAELGYRYLNVGYDGDVLEYDLSSDGLVAGVGIRF